MADWDPTAYMKFGDERTRPSIDLVSRIALEAPATAIDLGCGPGNSTQVLRRRWPEAHVTGMDSSPEMIAAAARSHPDQTWEIALIEDWSPDAPLDLVFSNAALQWTRDLAGSMRRLFCHVAPGGALAIQIPSAEYSAVRRFIHDIASDEAWASRMDGARAALTMEAPHVYYDALAPDATSIDLWETEYHHVMESPEAIVDWISSTGLRPFLDALATDDERQRFLRLLTERVAASYASRADGRALFPFRRTFVIAYR